MLYTLLLVVLCIAGAWGGVDSKLGYITADDSEFEGHEGDFFKFVSRPDIQAPRWQVDIHEPDQVAPGYWFVAPYEHVFRPAPLPAWVGPHIYDGHGDLVWSGASLFQGSDSYDFRISNFGDEDLMTFEYRDDCAAIFMDTNFKTRKEGRFADDLGDLNMHDLNLVDGGNRALVLTKLRGIATEQMSRDVGLQGDLCHAAFDGFKVMDTTTDQWQPVFEWSTFDHIPLTESTMTDRDIEKRCSVGWDYMHLNSIDKCPDGNFLLSARHSDTIYFINGTDGAILSRLGGRHSDFQQDFQFSRQHDIRCRGQNGGVYDVSFLDNAKGHDSQDATNAYSRGILAQIDTSVMKASLKQEYAHPAKGYAKSRGNVEIMENGNVFMGWAGQCLQSEYTADGRLIMEAKLVPEFLGTYRAYKFPFKGEPTQPPDVHSEVFENRGGNGAAGDGSLTTHVYVSWNGATEVKEWWLYRSDSSAAKKELIAKAKRSSFETLVMYEGYVSYVVVVAIDAWGHEMWHGRSGVVMTVHPKDMALAEAESAENASVLGMPAFTFLAGFLSMGVLLVAAWALSRAAKGSTGSALLSRIRRGQRQTSYLPLAESEKEAEARDPTPQSVQQLRTRERSESKLESNTGFVPMRLEAKSLHRRGDSTQRAGKVMPMTP